MSFPAIFLEIPVIAIAKARAKRSASGVAYIPKKTRSFEAEIRWHWMLSKNKMIPIVPTRLLIYCLLPKPGSANKKVIMPATRPDIDNYAKSIMDGLTGFAWKDDNQITSLIIGKRFVFGDDSPKITVAIYPDSLEWGL